MTYSEPILQDLSVVLRAPQVVLSGRSGDIDGSGQGFLSRDTRHLRTLTAEIDGRRLTPVGRAEAGEFGHYEGVDAPTNYLPMDGPSLHLTRYRTITSSGFNEQWSVSNAGLHAASVKLTLRADTDLAAINIVRSGLEDWLVSPIEGASEWTWERNSRSTRIAIDPEPQSALTSDDQLVASWTLSLDPGGSFTLDISVVADDHSDSALQLQPAEPIYREFAKSLDGAGRRLAERSLQDINALLLTESGHPEDVFPAAGAPWYFTLFGRDSIWTALLLSDVETSLGHGVLNALQRFQGVSVNAESEEQPGRIPHEVRSERVRVYGVLDLPPVYYGNIDTTALWIVLAHRIWSLEGKPPLAPSRVSAIEAALQWVATYGDSDGDNLVEYAGGGANGLAHQAWKDSPTGITHADGRTVKGPIAACEVQGYAYAAAIAGADLLESSGVSSAKWRAWAASLKQRFRATFWTSDEHGRYPALALDGDKAIVEGAASNMAHLLGTGILDRDEIAAVVDRLRCQDLDSGYGLRTLSDQVPAFAPLSYHRGSVWPHDTAIAIRGLLAEGYIEDAKRLSRELVRASTHFEGRLPELYGGDSASDTTPLTSYPTACFPQAWAAAAGLVAVKTLTEPAP